MMQKFNVPTPLRSRWSQSKVSAGWLLKLDPGEYEQALRIGGYSEHFIQREVVLLKEMQLKLAPSRGSKKVVLSPDLAPYLSARKRVKGAKQREQEDDPVDLEMRRLMAHTGEGA